MEDCVLDVIRDAHGKYVHFAALPPLFFDLARDPHERADLSGDPRQRARIADYAQRLLSWRLKHGDKTLTHIRVSREAGLSIRDARTRAEERAAPTRAR
jgi:arylsulfatase A-like enzyme